MTTSRSGAEDPRVVRSREAVLDSARTLLVQEGPAAVTHQRIAQHAGVGRATVYRHWPSLELLLQALMGEVDMPFLQHPQRDLAPWLKRELRHLADELAMPPVARVAVSLLHAAQWDAATRAHRDELVTTLTRRLAAALAGAALDDGIGNHVDASEIAAQVLGPLVYRTLLQGQTVSDALVDRVIVTALGATAW